MDKQFTRLRAILKRQESVSENVIYEVPDPNGHTFHR